jgi:hypothetical protein
MPGGSPSRKDRKTRKSRKSRNARNALIAAASALLAVVAMLIVTLDAGADSRSHGPGPQMAPDAALAPRSTPAPTAKAAGVHRARKRPKIVVQPRNVVVPAGRLAGFTAAASGVPAARPQWQRSTNGGRKWNNIPGAHRATLTFTAKSAQSGTRYRAVFTNAAGRAITRIAVLTVQAAGSGHPTSTAPAGSGSGAPVGSTGSGSSAPGPSAGGPGSFSDIAPQVTAQPVGATVLDGEYATFTAAASGTPAPAVQWEVSSDGGQTWTQILNATAATYTFKPNSSENANEYRAVFTNGAGSVTTNPAALVVATDSANWAGYIALGHAFSFVTGSWNVPAVTCTGTASTYSSQWVGIDGVEDPSVEQDGTESDCVNGVPTYSAWYAMWGDSEVNGGDVVQLSPSSYPVQPGDAITASVRLSGTTWTLAISDITADWQFTTDIPSPSPAPPQSSAEWVVERPVEGGALPPLSDFGTASFTGAAATDSDTSGPISAFSDQRSEMVALTAPTVLAMASPLIPSGDGFSVTWNAGS